MSEWFSLHVAATIYVRSNIWQVTETKTADCLLKYFSLILFKPWRAAFDYLANPHSHTLAFPCKFVTLSTIQFKWTWDLLEKKNLLERKRWTIPLLLTFPSTIILYSGFIQGWILNSMNGVAFLKFVDESIPHIPSSFIMELDKWCVCPSINKQVLVHNFVWGSL